MEVELNMLQSWGINLHIVSTIGMITMALTVIALRMRAIRKPVSEMKILMPPIGMSTGFLMFLFPFMQIPLLWGFLAFLIGAVFFSYPLIRTSHFEVVNRKIYLLRSKSFIFILLFMLAIRLALHDYIEHFVSIPQTGSLFFLLAFGMLLPWRIVMYVRYQKVLKQLHTQPFHSYEKK